VSSQTFLDINTTTGEIERKTALATSSGATDANKIIRTGADGKLDPSLMPSTGSDTAEAITTSEALAAGDWVNIYVTGGARRVRKALATDGTKPAHGFVTAVVNNGAEATVYTQGENGKVPLTGFTANDAGLAVFLSAATAGACTKTPPADAGNIIQRIGYVLEVGATVRVHLDVSSLVKL
jgi:hypothetical protein